MRRLLIAAAVVAGSATAGAFIVSAAPGNAVGAVYTATNAEAGNQVLVYDRTADGQLTLVDTVNTGGQGVGPGVGLGNQGGVRLTDDGRFLLVVNAGSHDISVFDVTGAGLILTDRESSGGLRPVSVAVSGGLVYALNAGGSASDVDNVSGFWLSDAGDLEPIAGSTRPLSDVSTGPAQVEFSPDGRTLVVTEKAPSAIGVFPVGKNGLLGTPTFYTSNGITPFGFAFGKRNQVFVSEAFGGAPDASAVSSYQVSKDGSLVTIDPSVPNTESAACWLVVSNSGRYLYVTNTGSSTISAYEIRPDGSLSLIDPDGASASTGAGSSPIDLAFSVNGRYLYALSAGTNTITGYRVGPHGDLEAVGAVDGLPAGRNGLAAR